MTETIIDLTIGIIGVAATLAAIGSTLFLFEAWRDQYRRQGPPLQRLYEAATSSSALTSAALLAASLTTLALTLWHRLT